MSLWSWLRWEFKMDPCGFLFFGSLIVGVLVLFTFLIFLCHCEARGLDTEQIRAILGL